jgi:hypothetical protein
MKQTFQMQKAKWQAVDEQKAADLQQLVEMKDQLEKSVQQMAAQLDQHHVDRHVLQQNFEE